MLSPFISGKTSRELLQVSEKGRRLGFAQPKGLPLCLGVGAGCEGLGDRLRCAWRHNLAERMEDLCVGPGGPRRRPSPVLPSPQCLACPDSPPPLLFLLEQHSPGGLHRDQLPMRRSPGLAARPLLVSTQQVGLDPLSHSSLTQGSRSPAKSKPEACPSFQSQRRCHQALTRKNEQEFSPLPSPGPVHPYLLPSAK